MKEGGCPAGVVGIGRHRRANIGSGLGAAPRVADGAVATAA